MNLLHRDLKSLNILLDTTVAPSCATLGYPL